MLCYLLLRQKLPAYNCKTKNVFILAFTPLVPYMGIRPTGINLTFWWGSFKFVIHHLLTYVGHTYFEKKVLDEQ